MTTGSVAVLAALSSIVLACGPGGFGVPIDGEETSDSTEVSTDASPDVPSESSSTSMSTSSTSTSMSTASDFVPTGDPGPENSCDPWFQDCPEGEKCVPYASTGGTWDANKCVPLLGDQGVGEPCIYGGFEEATDDCDATSFCFNVVDVDGELIGTCTAFCTGTPDDPQCPEGSSCALSSDATLIACIPTCDPLVQDCGANEACYWTDSEFECAPTTLDLPPGEPCGFINDCASGLICVDAINLPSCGGAACCTSFCDLDLGDEPCAALLPETACVPLFEQPPPNYENVGICITPA